MLIIEEFYSSILQQLESDSSENRGAVFEDAKRFLNVYVENDYALFKQDLAAVSNNGPQFVKFKELINTVYQLAGIAKPNVIVDSIAEAVKKPAIKLFTVLDEIITTEKGVSTQAKEIARILKAHQVNLDKFKSLDFPNVINEAISCYETIGKDIFPPTASANPADLPRFISKLNRRFATDETLLNRVISFTKIAINYMEIHRIVSEVINQGDIMNPKDKGFLSNYIIVPVQRMPRLLLLFQEALTTVSKDVNFKAQYPTLENDLKSLQRKMLRACAAINQLKKVDEAINQSKNRGILAPLYDLFATTFKVDANVEKYINTTIKSAMERSILGPNDGSSHARAKNDLEFSLLDEMKREIVSGDAQGSDQKPLLNNAEQDKFYSKLQSVEQSLEKSISEIRAREEAQERARIEAEERAEAERKQKEEEAIRKALEDNSHKKQEEDARRQDALRKKADEERRRAEEEARKKREEALRQQQEERRKEVNEALRKKLEDSCKKLEEKNNQLKESLLELESTSLQLQRAIESCQEQSCIFSEEIKKFGQILRQIQQLHPKKSQLEGELLNLERVINDFDQSLHSLDDQRRQFEANVLAFGEIVRSNPKDHQKIAQLVLQHSTLVECAASISKRVFEIASQQGNIATDAERLGQMLTSLPKQMLKGKGDASIKVEEDRRSAQQRIKLDEDQAPREKEESEDGHKKEEARRKGKEQKQVARKDKTQDERHRKTREDVLSQQKQRLEGLRQHREVIERLQQLIEKKHLKGDSQNTVVIYALPVSSKINAMHRLLDQYSGRLDRLPETSLKAYYEQVLSAFRQAISDCAVEYNANSHDADAIKIVDSKLFSLIENFFCFQDLLGEIFQITTTEDKRNHTSELAGIRLKPAAAINTQHVSDKANELISAVEVKGFHGLALSFTNLIVKSLLAIGIPVAATGTGAYVGGIIGGALGLSTVTFTGPAGLVVGASLGAWIGGLVGGFTGAAGGVYASSKVTFFKPVNTSLEYFAKKSVEYAKEVKTVELNKFIASPAA